jgi:hypothetical protein
LAPMLQERLSRRVRRQLLRTLKAILSMHGRWKLLHTVVYSVCWTGTTGRAAPSVGWSWWAAAPGLTSLVPPRRTTLQLHSPRMTRSREAPPLPRPHRAPDALTYSEGYIRRRPRTRGDQESARSGTRAVDTPDSVDSIYLNCFCMILFYF